MKRTILALTFTLVLSSALPVRAAELESKMLESEMPAHTHFVGAQNIALGGVGQPAAQSPSSSAADTNNPTNAYLGLVSLALLVFGF